MRKCSLATSTIVLLLLISQSLFAGDIERRQAKRIHDRLTGVPPSESVLNEMEDRISNSANSHYDPSGKTAAEIALQDPAFYNVTLKNWAAPWTNEEQTIFTPLNDYTATVIGMVRDDIDFRKILYEDIIYTGNFNLLNKDGQLITPYHNEDNLHYQELEALGPEDGDLSDINILQKKDQSAVTQLDEAATAGVITTRASARAFLIQGTNRALFRFTMLNHLCNDLEQIKDNSRTPDRVHQDVARSPGGDSQIYLNSCVGCHAGMDGLLGAYAYLDLAFTEDGDGEVNENTAALEYTPGEVQAKYLINSNNFKQGFITTDDSWINYWRNGPNALLGWNDYPGVQKDAKGHSYGNGPKSMGKELAYSDAFAQCQVKKAFKVVCFRDPDNYAADRSEVSTIVGDFVASGYKMKRVFRDVAAYCKGN
jgi:hypothetical protein